ncbi:hypothetical protein [Phycobacter sp. K97]|uniref:hypothetical protein n=1 Tax=Phycobacter sedimenti TaxID=3133977 RepID=UPI00311F2725
MIEAEGIEAMVTAHKQAEVAAAKRSLLFLLPFLSLVVCGLFALTGIEVIEPWHWFLGLFPALLLGWTGCRRLARVKKVNQEALRIAVESLEKRIRK